MKILNPFRKLKQAEGNKIKTGVIKTGKKLASSVYFDMRGASFLPFFVKIQKRKIPDECVLQLD